MGMSQQTTKQIVEIWKQMETSNRRDDFSSDSIHQLIQHNLDLTQGDPVANAIWHSCMARFYDRYHDENSWIIDSRTEMETEPEDFKEWDLKTLDRHTDEHWRLSLQNADLLQRTPIEDWKPLLNDTSNFLLTPTLYDLLAIRYMRYLQSQDFLNRSDRADLPLKELWNPATFLTVEIPLSETPTCNQRILRLYQQWARYLYNRPEKKPYINKVLECYYILHDRGMGLEDSETWYLKKLIELEDDFRGYDGIELLYWLIAREYQRCGDLYEENSDLCPEAKDYYVLAVQYFEKIRQTAPKSLEADNAAAAISMIKRRNLNVKSATGSFMVAPGKPILAVVSYRNITECYLNVMEISQEENEKLETLNYDDFLGRIVKMKPCFTEKIELVHQYDYREHTGYVIVPAQKAGSYLLVFTDKPLSTSVEAMFSVCYQVTDIELFYYERNANDQLTALVVNRTTGEPLSGAVVRMETESKVGGWTVKEPMSLKTNSKGFVYPKIKKDGLLHLVSVQWNGQTLWLRDGLQWGLPQQQENEVGKIDILTDRSLYRPGQKVYFKGILRQEVLKAGETTSMKLVADKKVSIVLKDVNYQKVAEQHLVTNEYGSVAGSFDLPQGGLTGSYTIEGSVEGAQRRWYATFWVEEYKRPTFEVTVETPKETYRAGQTVHVEGVAEAFAGYGISEAQVNYRVTRSVTYPWRRYGYNPCPNSVMIDQGQTVSDGNGRFAIDFVAKEMVGKEGDFPLYRYVVDVDVTDVNGETRSGSTRVVISNRSLVLEADVPSFVTVGRDENRFPVSLTNVASQPQDGTVHYQIFALTAPAQYLYPVAEAEDFFVEDAKTFYKMFPHYDFKESYDRRQWPAKLIARGDIAMSKEEKTYLSVPNWGRLSDGYYRILLTTEEPDGQVVEREYETCIHHEHAKRCSAYAPLWLSVPQKVAPGDTLRFEVGSYLPDAEVLCEMSVNRRLVISQWIHLSKNVKSFEYPVTDQEAGSITVSIFTMQNGKKNRSEHTVSVPNTKQELHFDFIHFKDKTLPGSAEEYQIRLTDREGHPVNAEVLCTMYDYSLDALGGAHRVSCDFNFHHGRYGHDLRNLNNCSFRTQDFSNQYLNEHHYPYLDFWLDMSTYSRGRLMAKSANASAYFSDYAEDNDELVVDAAVAVDLAMDEEVPMSFVASGEGAGAAPGAQSVEQSELKESVEPETVRTNFDETAFFYPMLRTDENGDIYVAFTMPESLTKWKMQGVAHNLDLQYGTFMKYVQTQKEVMLVPNAPRFLREGDMMVFSAKVVNKSASSIQGFATLQFFDAVTQQPIAMVGEERAPYDIPAGGVQEVHFTVSVPFGMSAVTYRMIAHNLMPEGLPGDGEEKMLPVLTNRILVTETMPLYISRKGSKTFTFNKLRESFSSLDDRDAMHGSSTLKHYRLTLEFTPNPLWNALQAMPYMMEYPHDCNEQIFSRYYANIMATTILNSNPRIKETFDRWALESPDAFCSALEKNQELKQVMIEETPWLLDAQREGTNKQNVALLFDLQRMSKEEKKTLHQLEQNQNDDGGWPWFSGGQTSNFVTTYIVAGFGHLKTLHIPTEASSSMLKKAVSYLDEEMYQRYQNRKKYDVQYVNETYYLYARSFYLQDKIAGKYKNAYDTCYKATMKNWKSQSFYTQAMLALIAYRNGDKATAVKIVQYLKSMAQHSEEMGMFWKRQGLGYYWYEQPIERQAMMIEAFHTVTPEDVQSVEEMQLWLLKQKQTQHWGSTKATTEACYALTFNQADISESDASVTVGGHQYPDENTKTDAGSGYFKTSWEGSALTPAMADVTVRKGNKGPAWGGLYWQYFEHIDKVSESDDKNLKIQKQLYKVGYNAQGEVLEAITSDSPLQVGDKVRVRVVITCDRDMEFVHLKDMRAAAFEPVNVFSQYKYQDGLFYYEATKDVATHFFIDWMPKGKYVFEYTLVATMAGTYSNGITHIECMYAPEFQSHSQGIRVTVE